MSFICSYQTHSEKSLKAFNRERVILQGANLLFNAMFNEGRWHCMRKRAFLKPGLQPFPGHHQRSDGARRERGSVWRTWYVACQGETYCNDLKLRLFSPW